MIFVSEEFSTRITLVRFLPSMNAFVPIQMVFSFEAFTSCTTLMFFSTMNKLVPHQTLLASERFPTLIIVIIIIIFIYTARIQHKVFKRALQGVLK